MKHTLKEMIEHKEDVERSREQDSIFWEFIFDSYYDLDSAGDR